MPCKNRYDFSTLGFTDLDSPIQLCTIGEKSCPNYTPFLEGGVKKVGNYWVYGYCKECD